MQKLSNDVITITDGGNSTWCLLQEWKLRREIHWNLVSNCHCK